MGKVIDADKLKKEISQIPVWTSLSIIEVIDEMVKECEEGKDD